MPRPRRERVKLFAVLSTAAALCVPAAAAAQSGGMPVPDPVAPTSGATGYGDPGKRALVVPPTALTGTMVIVRGTMPGAARRAIILQRLVAGSGWRNVRRGRVRSTERFMFRWHTRLSGRIDVRAVIARRRTARARSRSAAVPVAAINVYKPARATYYGPGLWGNMTACGQVLTPLLFGVAHRQLKCGTLVALLYQGREITVPVIDRGPFHAGYAWDLTQATADALGFAQADSIGYLRVEQTGS